MIGTYGLALAPGWRIICVSSRPSKIGIAQSVMHDVGHVVGEGFEAGGAVFRLVHLARAEAVQQRAQDAPHMRVVVDDEEAQPVEIDADHDAIQASGRSSPCRAQAKVRLLRKG